jgi:hypothetical protein
VTHTVLLLVVAFPHSVLTKDAAPHGAGTLTALGPGGSADSTDPADLVVVGGTGAYRNVVKSGGTMHWATSGETTIKLNPGWRA